MANLEKHLWPLSRLDEALTLLARRHKLVATSVETPPMPADFLSERSKFARWLETSASILGLEAEPTFASYTEVDQLIDRAAPAVLRVLVEGQIYLLVLWERRRGDIAILGPDRLVHRLDREEIRVLLCEYLEAPLRPEIDRLLTEAGVPERHRPKARQAILRERLSDAWIGSCWLIRLPSTQSLWQHARAVGLPNRFLFFLGSYLIYYSLWIASWWLAGKGALQGRFDLGWLYAWALILFTLIPFRMLSKWLEGSVATGIGILIKQKLLFGALQLHPDDIRHQGAGQLFSRVAESETLEAFSLQGGILGLLGAIELILAALVLAAGPAGLAQILLLAAWIAFAFVLGWLFFRSRHEWTHARLNITHLLIEGMVGYRTRLVQEAHERWHEAEDQQLENYFAHSQSTDRVATLPTALAGRGWVVVGLLGLAPSFISGQSSPALLAVGLGGIMLAYRAFHKLTASLTFVAAAIIAYRQLHSFLQAARRSQAKHTFAALLTVDRGEQEGRELLVNARDLVFRYRENGKAVLDGYDFHIARGERILLQGPSGGGKSTLVSLLTGLRQPNSGLVLLQGLDWQTLGSEGWRQRVIAAPQFHENHVLTGTFAFNLLMGRGWPPRREDLDEAKAICHELGLGELLQNMPGGLMQMVGETGWQLSHGEKSRMYIARALLQNAPLIILDESFAALDPENLHKAMQCALSRAKTLMVIAHP